MIQGTSVRNLGVTVDSSLSFRTHVNRVVSSCFHQLRGIKSSLKALPQETAKSLVNCFVVSRFDYCNSLLAGVPQVTLDRLQSVMNAAARMLCTVGRRARVSDLLGQRSAFTTCATEDPVVMYKALHAWRQTTLDSSVGLSARTMPAGLSGLRSAATSSSWESGDKVRRQSIRHLKSSDVERPASDSQKFQHLVMPSNLLWRLICLFDYILEAAATVVICDGALESVLRVTAQ